MSQEITSHYDGFESNISLPFYKGRKETYYMVEASNISIDERKERVREKVKRQKPMGTAYYRTMAKVNLTKNMNLFRLFEVLGAEEATYMIKSVFNGKLSQNELMMMVVMSGPKGGIDAKKLRSWGL